MSRRSTRRDFLKQSTLAGVGFRVAGGIALGKSNSANEKLNIASIGVGGKGDGDCSQAANHGNLVAICDIDDGHLNAKAKDFPKAAKYNDFRKMFDEMGKNIDAVTVSTPDHTHAVASIMAIRMKKHVYCQKPLTHSVHEARLMRELAAKYKVCTQMGNQGTASDGLRRAVEIIRAGAIGPVREVHVWTNRPIWPQAPSVTSRPKETPPVPKHVHWDLFLGPAPNRNYSPAYHPFKWRGWWDFGTGALGDMACHTANMAFMALKLGYPTSVVAECGEINPETYPGWAKILYEFPKREDMPPVKFYWYEGSKNGKRVLPPTEYTVGKEKIPVLRQREKISDSGSLLVGDKGVLFSPNDYGEQYRLLPEEHYKDYQGPEKTLPRNGGGDDGMKAEWVEAIKGNKPSIAMSNFDYAAMLTETILLGNVAMRVGKKIEWDGPKMKVTNSSDAEQYIKPKYREGWKL
jgi:predicted dehydrogenase